MSSINRNRMLEWRSVKPILKYTGLFIWSLFMLFPLYYSFQMSLKDPRTILSTTFGIPWVTFQPPAIGSGDFAWVIMWTKVPLVEYTIATFVAAFGTALVATIAATFAAYTFGRLQFRFKEPIFTVMVSAFIFPKILLAIPLFILIVNLGLMNTYLGLILAFSAFTLPYTIWLLRGFFEKLPKNLEDAAMVDGCSKTEAFFRVILPISRPALVSVFLLAFLLAWHHFIMAFVIGTDALHRTFPPGILRLRTEFYVANLHLIFAATFIVIVIPVIMYIYLQKYLIQGLGAEAATKG